MNFKKLIQELKRRNVFKVATVYAIAGWVIIQLAATLTPILLLPSWVPRVITVMIFLGFPIAVIIAWAFELTPEGVKRTDEVPVQKSVTNKAGRKLNVVLGVLLVFAIGFIFYQQFFRTQPTVSGAVSKGIPIADSVSSKSIAVLPFENLSTDSANAYFADGMQDMVLTKLADIGGLKVISRTSTEQYKSHPGDLKTVAKQLGVGNILEGSVQKSGKQVLINVQLIDARTDNHLWAKAYTQTLNNVFGVEGEVAGEIARTLKVKLDPVEKNDIQTAPTYNGQAFSLYLKAKSQMDRFENIFTLPDSALEWYHEAIQLDTSFALAYANLGAAELTLSGLKNTDSLRNQALLHIRKAIQINPQLALAHAYLGDLYRAMDLNDKRAKSEWEQANRLSPNNADVLADLSSYDIDNGNWDDALQKAKMAIALDPQTGSRYSDLARIYEDLRQYKKAFQLYDQAENIDPKKLNPIGEKIYLYCQLGKFQQAKNELQKLEASSSSLLAHIRFYNEKVYIDDLQHTYAQEIVDLHHLDSLRVRMNKRGVGLFNKAYFQAHMGGTYYFMGKKKKARPYLQMAVAYFNNPSPNETPNEKRLRITNLSYDEALLGREKEAIAAIDRGLKPSHLYLNHYGYLYCLSEVYALFGDADHAIPLLNQVFAAKGTGGFMTGSDLSINHVWDKIRKDVGFQALIKKYGQDERAAS